MTISCFQKYKNILFPHFSQLEYSDCGATCLKMILKFYGKDCSLEYLRELCQTTREGVSMSDISKAAQKLKFSVLPILSTNRWFKENVVLPCIIHWKQDHFVVLYKIKNGNFYISDPAYGKVKLKQDVFYSWWKENSERGIALFLEPTSGFEELTLPYNKYMTTFKKIRDFFKTVTKNQRKLFVWISFTMAMLLVIVYVFPRTIQLVYDKGIHEKNVSVLISILAFQLLLVVGQAVFTWMQNWFRVKASMNINIKMLSLLLYKIIKLPIRFFDIKTPTDILQRINDQRNIEVFITQDLLQIIFSLIMAFVLAIRLFLYNTTVGIIFSTLTIVSVFWVALFYKWRQRLDYTNFRLASENYNLVNEFIYGMIEIKINEAQHKKISQWDDLQKRMLNLKMRSLKLGVYQNTGVQILTQLKNIIITLFCAYAVIQGAFTMGVMLSVGYIVGMLVAPIDSIVGFSKSAQDAQLSFIRLDEILSRENEVKADNVNMPSLTKGVFVKDVFFKYDGGGHNFVIKGVNFVIPLNKTTAIVGSSGSGKSTLLKLLLNFYQPQKGNILLDETELSKINPEQWRRQCGIVLQDGYIFSGTIGENIALGDSIPDGIRLYEAANVACLTDFIETLPMKFDTKIGGTGSGISGGQKQRILIARAVYQNPNFIFFDEATSNLDSNNERKIMRNLTSFFINKTVIIIAHRLSTVKRADQIIVLEDGHIKEVGTHGELLANRDKYYDLIRDQLEL